MGEVAGASGEALRVVELFAPLVAGLVFHGVCLRFGWLAGLARAIDRGRCWRGQRLFGANKTWRGVAAVSLGTGVATLVQAAWLGSPLADAPLAAGALGLVLGAAAMLSELPNSLLKRQLGIGPGQAAGGLREPVFWFADQVDMLAGAWLVAACVVPVTPLAVALSVGLFVVTHQLLSLAGYALGMRRTIR